MFAILTVSNLPRRSEDQLVDLFFSHGAEGVAEDLPFKQKDLRYDPEVQETERMVLNVYFSEVPTEQARLEWTRRIQDVVPEAQVAMRVEAERDWLEEWKKGFQPFLFADPFWVVPRWCEIPAKVKNTPQFVLLMEPGMAFGTGTHETTRLAAGYVVKTLRASDGTRKASGPAYRVLDVGTGTGILALIAERLGASECVGLDIDPEARRTARENLELNQSRSVKIEDFDLSHLAQSFSDTKAPKFDVVIANIIDGVLMTLAKDLKACLAPGGKLILSGILTDREDQFHKEFAAITGLKELERSREGEWCASIWLTD